MDWTRKFLHVIECEEEKAEPKSYSSNFCTLEVFFFSLSLFFVVVVVVVVGWLVFF